MKTVVLNQRNLKALIEKVESLRKRAELLGLTLPAIRVTRQWDETDKKGRVWSLAEVEIEAPVVKLDGWRFAAKVEPLVGTESGSENLVKRCGGYDGDLPESLRTTDTRCDHCKTVRPRSAVYALTHEDGRWIQVGRDCLRDFLGHPDAERLADWLAMFEQMMDPAKWRDERDDDWGREEFEGGKFSIDPETWLTFVAAAVERYGWLSATKAREFDRPSTSSRAFDGMFSKDRDDRLHPTEHNATDAKAAGEWAQALGGEDGRGLNDYEWNLRVLSQAGGIGWRNLALAASLLQAWRRDTGRIPEPEGKRPSEWQGIIGQRGEWTLTVKTVADYDTEFGLMHLNVAENAGGNLFVWRSGRTLGKVGETVRVKATVKEHGSGKVESRRSSPERRSLRPSTLTQWRRMEMAVRLPRRYITRYNRFGPVRVELHTDKPDDLGRFRYAMLWLQDCDADVSAGIPAGIRERAQEFFGVPPAKLAVDNPVPTVV
jgi:hypothetical protein